MDHREPNDDRNFQEETAAELAPRVLPATREERDVDDYTRPIEVIEENEGGGTTLGVVGLVLAIASLFFLPFLLSLIGIGAGYFAYKRGATGLGKWAMGIGIVSLIGSMLFAPFIGY
nr:DUF4190 domain-containing protein [Ammoniphilus resinae]